MKLGTYVEVINYVDDTAQAGAYYQKLGLQSVGTDVYRDGRYHLRMVKSNGTNPTLRYYSCDIDAIKASGLEITDSKLKSPQGVVIELTPDKAPHQLPHSDVMLAPATSRLGKFGELSVFVDDLSVEQAFWEKCGYITSGVQSDPMPWGIWSDDMFLIGIHQYGMVEPFSITHFAPDMKDVNTILKSEGFAVEPFMEDKGDMSHTTLMTPYGIKYYLFTGDISKENP